MRKLFTLLVMVLPFILTAEVVSEDFSGWSDGSYGATSSYTDGNGGMWENNNALVNSSNGCGSSAMRFNDDSGANEYVLYMGLDGAGKDVGIGTVSFSYRHWDGDGSDVSFQVEYNMAGAGWTAIGGVVSVTSTTCMMFSEVVEITGDDILFRIRAVTDDERLLIDDILITDFDAAAPIELSSFSASKKSNDVALNWSTASEVNNDYFIVEHSRDGQNFRTIGEVKGAGTTENVQEYSFDHDAPAKGTNYYRLQQVDYSRAFSYSQVESVIWEAAGSLEIFPTLVNEIATVVIEKESGTKEILVHDLSGKLVGKESTNGSGNYELNIATLASGTYFVSLHTNSSVRTAKIVKQ